MDFTREPIIETVITPKDGYHILVRNSKHSGQEEFIVDVLEVVNFGKSSFFRNRERPKAFLLPVSDYEILEVREQRLGIKLASLEARREVSKATKEEPPLIVEQEEESEEAIPETRPERRREKRRPARRKRTTKESKGEEEAQKEKEESQEKEKAEKVKKEPVETLKTSTASPEQKETTAPISAILPPPSTLIRDELQRLRQSEEYRGAFYETEQEEISQKPMAQEPMAQEPMVQEPMVQESVDQKPVVQESVVRAPTETLTQEKEIVSEQKSETPAEEEAEDAYRASPFPSAEGQQVLWFKDSVMAQQGDLSEEPPS